MNPNPSLPPLARTRWPGLLLALAVAATVATAAWQSSDGLPHSDSSAPVRWQRLLHFEDRANGDIAVLDAGNGQEITRIQGEQGFARGTLRALARERKRRELGPQQPFELVAYADGRLTLRDQATGQRIYLESFGPTNAAIFARLQAPAGELQAAIPSGTPP